MTKAPQEHSLEEIRAEYLGFPAAFESLLMATVSADGIPNASYAAYVHQDNFYYVYVSELARHTENLRATGKVSLLFIENEDSASHLFARRRVTYDCEAVEVPRGESEFERILGHFEAQFGKLMEVLKSLRDFHLFRIRPLKGTYVKGFAKAFEIEEPVAGTVRHINDAGHRTADAATEHAMRDQVA